MQWRLILVGNKTLIEIDDASLPGKRDYFFPFSPKTLRPTQFSAPISRKWSFLRFWGTTTGVKLRSGNMLVARQNKKKSKIENATF